MKTLLAAAFLLVAQPARAWDGCLGADVLACLDAIKPHLTPQTDRSAREQLKDFVAGDIAGKRKPKTVVSVSYLSQFAEAHEIAGQLVNFDVLASLRISGVRVGLRGGAGAAETEAEYAKTHMYETALFALGSRPGCKELADAHAFYLYFHTRIRPRLAPRKLEREKDAFNPASDRYADTGWVKLCGRDVNFSVASAEWGAAQADMTRKYSLSGAALSFR